MTEELETAVCAAMAKLAAPIPLSTHEARIFRMGFLAGAVYYSDKHIAQLDEKLERLK